MYEKSCEMIYEMISKRIKSVKDHKGIKNYEFYPYDPNLISAITHNRRDPKKNKYLIPGGRIDKDDPNLNCIKVISDKLSFPSPVELILGSESEVEAYAGCLFRQLILDTIDSGDGNTKSMLYSVLREYIPFAKAEFFIEAYCSLGETVDKFINEHFHLELDEYSLELDYSIARLFELYKTSFCTMLREMFTCQPNTIKLNKRFSEFMSNYVILYMVKNKKDFLIDVTEVLEKSYLRWEGYLKTEMYRSPEAIGYHQNDDEIYLEDVIVADIAYVDSYADIQKKNELDPDIEVFINRWDPEMCL